ncbi:hypothetical protein G3O08_08615 [Cryomorpha ignava]|uniref:Type VI secretion system transmembrane protein TssO n=1 Tax=Cryomorpha ignava TaxID=101383 RepID=A0A7K3WRT6_9FLAO|nr:hypothetical protein [Cryomorpha ignava]NEN23562.1 hypothetical protein [Cryomorpha ignava]
MRPLNSKERQKAFWKFTLLFFLAVVPVCTAIYLYGRIDKAENAFLRSEYEKRVTVKATDINVNKYYEDFHQKIDDVNSLLTKSEPKVLNSQLYGDIDVAIKGIEVELQKFQKNVIASSRGSAVDSLTANMISSQIDNLKILNRIYRKTSDKIISQETELEDTNDKLTECQSKMN